jgi:DNA-binding transcriptional LysR family regulator
VELKSLKDQPFALPWLRRETSPGALRMREVIEQYFALHRFTPRQVVFQGSTIASVLSIVRARKQVVTVLAGLDLLAENKKSLCVRPLLPKAPVQTIGLIWRKDEPRSKEAKDFAVDIKLRIKDAEERAAQSKDPPPSSPQEPWWQEGGGG